MNAIVSFKRLKSVIFGMSDSANSDVTMPWPDFDYQGRQIQQLRRNSSNIQLSDCRGSRQFCRHGSLVVEVQGKGMHCQSSIVLVMYSLIRLPQHQPIPLI